MLGHRPRFRAEGCTLVWSCDRCDAPLGAKEYATAREAQHFARAFDRSDADDLGRRAPLGLTPLRMWRWLRDRR